MKSWCTAIESKLRRFSKKDSPYFGRAFKLKYIVWDNKC